MAADDAPLLEVAAHCRWRLVVEAIGEPPDVLLEGCPRGDCVAEQPRCPAKETFLQCLPSLALKLACALADSGTRRARYSDSSTGASTNGSP